jgi:glycosyltransferase involved in cell wall biosynthesis
MKISILLPSPSLSGGVRIAAVYADFLASAGHTVTVYAQAPRPSGWRNRLGNPFKYWQDKSRSDEFLRNRAFRYVQLKQWRRFEATDLDDADIAIATWWETAESLANFPDSKGRHVYLIQGLETFPGQPRERVLATYSLPFRQIVVSNWLRQEIKSINPAADPVVILNGIDRTQFFAPPRNKQRQPTIGFMHSGAALKGLDTTGQVLMRLAEKFPDLAIKSFGSCTLDDRIPQALHARIKHTVSPAQENIRHIYAGCDVWLTTSRSEGFNLAAAEAMSCRTPVVATRTGWPVAAIHDGVNGYCREIDDVDALLDGCTEVMSMSTDNWRACSDAAYAASTELTWPNACSKFLQTIESLASVPR